MKSITDVKNLKGKRVLVRTDFNVALGDDGIVDENEALRIQAGMKTLEFLAEQGAKVVAISHIGREPHESLRPIADYINITFSKTIGFIPEVIGDIATEAVSRLGDGQIVLLENLRSIPGETENSNSFAEQLARYGDIYVNDAFSASHREHASIVGIAQLLPAYVGIQCMDEITHLDRVLAPEHPLVVIMGGAKFGTKLELMKALLPKAETIIVGGALANRLYKDRGYEIGQSLVDDEGDTREIAHSEKVILPTRVIVEGMVKNSTEITNDESIVDIDSTSIENVAKTLQNAGTLLWNGPMGYYEGGFTKGTIDIAHMIAESGAMSIVGGGDTATVLYDENILHKFTFVSMAGGAMLEYLAEGTLPGIEVLK
jgi:phosphoglycerate kinase